MSDFGLPERQIIGRVDLQKGMFAILEQPPCKYWNRLEDCPSASPASIGIYWVLIGPLSIATMYGNWHLSGDPYVRARRHTHLTAHTPVWYYSASHNNNYEGSNGLNTHQSVAR
jgi:hypothetical protein